MTRRVGQPLIQVAVLAGAHGVRGDVRVKSFTGDPEACFTYGPLLAADGKPLLTVRQFRPMKDHFIVVPALPRQTEEWDALGGTALLVPSDALPPPEDADEFYHADLLGLPVYRDGVMIGRVRAIQDFGSGDLIDIAFEDGSGQSAFLPFTREVVPVVDISAGGIELGPAAADWLD